MIKDIPSSAIGTKVSVYYNLHNHKWSVIDYKTRRLIGHAPALLLKNFNTTVREAGRIRVINEKRKNVHAFINGTLFDLYFVNVEQQQAFGALTVKFMSHRPNEEFNIWQLTYNPYVHTTFMISRKDGVECSPFAIPSSFSSFAFFGNKRVYVI